MIDQEFGKVPSSEKENIIMVSMGISRTSITIGSLLTYRISLEPSSEGRFSFKNEYTSRVFAPLTWPFSNQINLSFAPNLVSTKSNISSCVPFIVTK